MHELVPPYKRAIVSLVDQGESLVPPHARESLAPYLSLPLSMSLFPLCISLICLSVNYASSGIYSAHSIRPLQVQKVPKVWLGLFVWRQDVYRYTSSMFI
jgi:hypothetical protein